MRLTSPRRALAVARYCLFAYFFGGVGACKFRLGVNESLSTFRLSGQNILQPSNGGFPIAAPLIPSSKNLATAFSGAMFAFTSTFNCPSSNWTMQDWTQNMGTWTWTTNASASTYSVLSIFPLHINASTAGQPYMLQNYELELSATSVKCDPSGLVTMSGSALVRQG